MKKTVTRAAETALAAGVAGGVLLIGAPVTLAQEAPTTAAGDGVLDGDAVGVDLDVPLTLCGLGVVGAGLATGTCDAALPAPDGDAPAAQASGDGVLTGNALGIDIDAPITVCGLGVALFGVATGACAPPPPPPGGPGPGAGTAAARADGDGLLAGNVLALDVDLPVGVCGLGVAVAGTAVGACAPAPAPATAPVPGGGLRTATDPRAPADRPSRDTGTTTGPDRDGTASGGGLRTADASVEPVAACGGNAGGRRLATGACPAHAAPPGSPSSQDHTDSDDAPSEPWSTASAGRLPRTGGATEVALPLGLGLLGTGLAFVAAARRRLRRLARAR